MTILLHKRTFYFIALIVTNLLFTGLSKTFAADITSTGTGGNWSSTSTWVGNAVPVAGDNVFIANGATVTVDVAASCASLTINSGNFSSTLTISGTNSLNVTGLVTINTPADHPKTQTIDVGSGSLTCGSINMTSSGPASRDCQLTISNGAVTVSGNITMAGNNERNHIIISGSGTLNIGGSITGGELITGTSTNSTVNYTGANQTVYPTTYQNLTLSGSGSKTLTSISTINGNFTLQGTASTSATSAMSITGDVFLGSGTSFNAGSYNHTVGGDWTRNGTFNGGTGTITFNGTSAQTISGTTSTSFNNLVINNNIGVSLDQNINISGTLTVNGVLNATTKQVTGTGNFTLSTTGTIITSSAAGIDGSIAVTGTKTFPSTGGTYNFESATTTPFSSSMPANAVISNLTIGADVTLNRDVEVSGTLTLNAGLLSIPGGNTLTLTNPTAISDGGTAFSNLKHIVTQVNPVTFDMGVLQVDNIPTTGYTFPVGNGAFYLPATITPDNASSFGVSVYQGATTNGEPNGTALSSAQKSKLLDAVWDITGSVPSYLTLGFPDAASLEGTEFSNASDLQQGIAHFTNNKWDVVAGEPDNNLNSVTRRLTSYSPVIPGIMNFDILPVRFSNVKASEKSGGVQVEFTNFTESDVDYYEVERSVDGKAFSAVKRLLPAKNDYASATYTWLDATAREGRVIYRIKAVEITGKIVYSGVVGISLGAKNSGLNVYAKGSQVALQISSLPAGKYQMQVFSAGGQLLSVETINHAGGSLSQTKTLNNVRTGVYILNISGAVQMQKRFVME